MAALRRMIGGILLTVALGAAGNSSLPSFYGAAIEIEDTGFVDLTMSFLDSVYAKDSVPFWGTALTVSELPLGRSALVSVRTGLSRQPFPRIAPVLQEVVFTVPVQRATFQAGIGFLPLRERDSWLKGARISGKTVTEEYGSVTIRNVNLFKGTLNGIVSGDSLRHVVFGCDLQGGPTTGTVVYRERDYSNDYEYVDYKKYGKGDGEYAWELGVGYLREFTYRRRPYKVLWSLEGFYEKVLAS